MRRKLSTSSILAYFWPDQSFCDLPGAPFFSEVAPMPSQYSDRPKDQGHTKIAKLSSRSVEIHVTLPEPQHIKECCTITISDVQVEVSQKGKFIDPKKDTDAHKVYVSNAEIDYANSIC